MKYKVLKVFCYILIAMSVFEITDFTSLHIFTGVMGIVASVFGIRLANGKKMPKASLAIVAVATVLFVGSVYAEHQAVKHEDREATQINLSDEEAVTDDNPAMKKASILVGMPFILAPSLFCMAAFREAWNNEK